MEERIKDKIEKIEDFLDFLMSKIPGTLDEYKENLEIKAICERYVEKIVESLIDLAVLIIKYLKLESPEDDDKSFVILSKNNIISEELSKKLSDAKGMRNIIAHKYGEIDDEIVFDAINNEIENDTNEFLVIVKKIISKIK